MQPPAGTQDAAPTREMPPIPAAKDNPLPAAPTIVSAQGEACAKCGALVAADQRYCIECGERRGDPRLPFMDGRTAAAPPAEPPASPVYPAGAWTPPPAPPKNKWASGAALLGTIAVLLLAMGVGVLIGNKGGGNTAAQQPVYLGGGATAATGPSESTGSTKTSDTAAASDSGETKSGVDASAIAKKNGVKLAKPDVDLGDSCEKGSVGCSSDGKFDGDYFK
ncbi:MAG: hypothetical protein QM648_09020 [Solirubrobacterales bacterium]